MRRNQNLKLNLRKFDVIGELQKSFDKCVDDVTEIQKKLDVFNDSRVAAAQRLTPTLRKLKAKDILSIYDGKDSDGPFVRISFRSDGVQCSPMENSFEEQDLKREKDRLLREKEEITRMIRLLKMSAEDIVPASLCKDILDYIR